MKFFKWKLFSYPKHNYLCFELPSVLLKKRTENVETSIGPTMNIITITTRYDTRT